MGKWAATLPFSGIFHNFDTPSTTGLSNCLILSILWIIDVIETRHATSLHLKKIAF